MMQRMQIRCNIMYVIYVFCKFTYVTEGFDIYDILAWYAY